MKWVHEWLIGGDNISPEEKDLAEHAASLLSSLRVTLIALQSPCNEKVLSVEILVVAENILAQALSLLNEAIRKER